MSERVREGGEEEEGSGRGRRRMTDERRAVGNEQAVERRGRGKGRKGEGREGQGREGQEVKVRVRVREREERKEGRRSSAQAPSSLPPSPSSLFSPPPLTTPLHHATRLPQKLREEKPKTHIPASPISFLTTSKSP